MFNLVAVALLLAIGTNDPPTAARNRHDYNHLRMPAQGTIYKGVMYGFFDDDWAHRRATPRSVDGIPLGKIAKKNWKQDPLMPHFLLKGQNYRYHVAFDALWFGNSDSYLNRWYFEDIQKLEADYLRNGPPIGENVFPGIFLVKLMEKYGKIWSADRVAHMEKFGAVPAEWLPPVAFDSVPISKIRCKTFLLMKKEKQIEAWDTKEVEYDKKKKQFKSLAAVENLETFDCPFLDDFYAVIRNNDYYFITESGKLYQAPPPKAGEKSRAMKELWVERPIVAVLHDADRDKVWLFVKGKNSDGNLDYFFELKESIRLESFDPAKLRPVNVEGRAKLLLQYIPLISPVEKK